MDFKQHLDLSIHEKKPRPAEQYRAEVVFFFFPENKVCIHSTKCSISKLTDDFNFSCNAPYGPLKGTMQQENNMNERSHRSKKKIQSANVYKAAEKMESGKFLKLNKWYADIAK